MYRADEKPVCGHDKPITSRRLCITCYNHHYTQGTLNQFPTSNHRLTDVITEYRHYRQGGTSHTDIANHIGMTYHALHEALKRAVKRGLLDESER